MKLTIIDFYHEKWHFHIKKGHYYGEKKAFLSF